MVRQIALRYPSASHRRNLNEDLNTPAARRAFNELQKDLPTDLFRTGGKQRMKELARQLAMRVAIDDMDHADARGEMEKLYSELDGEV